MTTHASMIAATATTGHTALTRLSGARRILALTALGATVATGALFGATFAPQAAAPAHTQIAAGTYQAGPGGSGGPGGW